MKKQISSDKKSPPGIFSLLKPYRAMVILLILFALFSNGLNLWLPRMIGHGIDAYNTGNFSYKSIIVEFTVVALIIFVFSYLQGIVQTFASERVARDLRTRVTKKISNQSFAFIEKTSPSKLLTNLTSDVDSVKLFISQAIVSIVSSLFIIIGATALLLSINWRLGLTTICIIPIIGGAYYIVLGKVKVLFKKSREVIDWLNKVITKV